MPISEILFHAHSGLRYLVLAAGSLAAVYALVGVIRRARYGAPAQTLNRIFVGLLDLQVLLGIVLLFVRAYYPALTGHVVMMVLAAVVAHGFARANRRRPPGSQSFGFMLLGTVLALGLIVGGIMAIGRSVV